MKLVPVDCPPFNLLQPSLVPVPGSLPARHDNAGKETGESLRMEQVDGELRSEAWPLAFSLNRYVARSALKCDGKFHRTMGTA
jgi:hypothetical protein